MTHDPRTKPLLEWNRLAQENTENAMISSMFEGVLKASEPIEAFSTWLLIGTAAIASFFVSNADKLLPVISRSGFITCGAFLCLSCFFGLLSKIFGLRCKVMSEIGTAVKKTCLEHLAKYNEEEEKIQKVAEFWGITLLSGIRMDRVLQEFLVPFPSWVKWLIMRNLKKNGGNPQIAHLLHVKNFQAQGMHAFFQSLCFLGFLGAGFVFTAAS